MKATRQGTVPILGGLLILMSLAAVGCSGPASLFEKGKTYNVALSEALSEGKFTVVEIGPAPWVKMKNEKGLDSWVNSNQIIYVRPE